MAVVREPRLFSGARPAYGTFNNAIAITPADGADLAHMIEVLVAGAAGTVKVDTPNQTGVTLTVAAGIPLPLRIAKVYATGTTATGLTGLY